MTAQNHLNLGSGPALMKYEGMYLIAKLIKMMMYHEEVVCWHQLPVVTSGVGRGGP